MICFGGLFLASCVSMGSSWKRDGVTVEEFAVDKEICRSYAQRQAKETHTSIIDYSSEGGINNEATYNNLMRQYSAQQDARKFFELCLTRRGYKKLNPRAMGKKA